MRQGHGSIKTKPFFWPQDSVSLTVNIAIGDGSLCSVQISAAEGNAWKSDVIRLESQGANELCVAVNRDSWPIADSAVQMTFKMEGDVRLYAFTFLPKLCSAS